jgi:fibronectin type 3 domain-containing protein
MFNAPRKFKQAFFFLIFFQLLLWPIMYLSGCGGSKNIPPASILTSGKLTLTWEDVTGATAYNVYLSTSPNITVLITYKISNVVSPFTITGLEPGKTYYFVIAVEDESGQTRKSKEFSCTVGNIEKSIQLGDFLIHSKPTIKSPTSKTCDVTLAWNNVPNATSYNIYWSETPGVTKNKGTKISNANNPHKINGLKKGKKYYFVVTAVNASGESKESEEISFIVGQ